MRHCGFCNRGNTIISMKNFLVIILFLSVSGNLFSQNDINSLLKQLDKTISERLVYTSKKESELLGYINQK